MTDLSRRRFIAGSALAADRKPVHGYRFPFPAFGHVAKSGNGYPLVPVLWQPL